MPSLEDYSQSNRYREAYERIPESSRSAFDQWLQAANQVSGGEDVIQNMFLEQYLDVEIFVEFLTAIGRCYDEIPSDPEPITAYKKACVELCKTKILNENEQHSFFCRGLRSQVNNGILFHRVYKLWVLKLIVSQGRGNNSASQTDWDELLELKREGDLEGYRQFLRNAIPCRTGDMAWAYFHESQEDTDPLAGRTCQQCLDQLGIPEEWYKPGKDENDDEGAWRIHYKISDQIPRHIPSFADTIPKGWNPYFQPTTDPRWGWTRPIGQPRGQRGVPEIVHQGWAPGREPRAMTDLEFLGIRD